MKSGLWWWWTVPFVAYVVVGCDCSGDFGVFGSIEEDIRNEHLSAAEQHKAEGRYREAIAEFEKALEHGAHEYSTWLFISQCFDRMGQYGDARNACEKALADAKGGCATNWLPLPKLISKYEGTQAAIKWIEDLRASDPDYIEYTRLLGEFHLCEKRYDKGLLYLKKVLEALEKARGFHFDENGDLVIDDETAYQRRTPVANLHPLLQDLCICTLRTNDLDSAYRYATMGLELSQGSIRHARYYPPKNGRGGDVEFRLFRARIHISRKEFDRAKAEIDHAKGAAHFGGFRYWEKDIKRAFEDLRQARDLPGK